MLEAKNERHPKVIYRASPIIIGFLVLMLLWVFTLSGNQVVVDLITVWVLVIEVYNILQNIENIEEEEDMRTELNDNVVSSASRSIAERPLVLEAKNERHLYHASQSRRVG